MLRVVRGRPFEGELRVPGDKSISHRAALIGALAEGRTEVEGFLAAGDCLSTLACLERLGVEVRLDGGGDGGRLVVVSGGPDTWLEPPDVLDAGNSGTTLRLLLGLLAGRPFFSVLTGDASLRRRPMRRVAEPLRTMGAFIDGREGGQLAPLAVRGGRLRPGSFRTAVASAQVKSAILLAGCQAEGVTTVEEPSPSRDHTERMLRAFGAEVAVEGPAVCVTGPARLRGRAVRVPGDISSAAFLLVAAALVPGSRLTVRDVGVNPTRTGVLDALQAMGARVAVCNRRDWGGEPVADVVVEAAELRGIALGGADIPRLIDEIPILAVAATQAQGVTEIRDAAELRVKESDRLAALARELRRLGARVEPLADGLRIEGPCRLVGAACRSEGDHRIAMALAVAGLVADGETVVDDDRCIAISYPSFADDLRCFQP
ncbi:MAG: 3-phosphoshikimate 1-carboxyvinyltransferase [Clostridia bacterium]|nr:3-phosphoshikimate 1-carboxyvinyltransferase [Clostridia bacterium]